MSRIIITEIQKRFDDIDVFRHVNNIHQQQYLDVAKSDYYRQVIGADVFSDRVALVMVSQKNDFLEQIRYEEDIFVNTRVESIGTKSITLHQQIVARLEDGTEQMRTDSRTVLVTFDREAQVSVEIPHSWRDMINYEI